ncbi:NhaC-type sodium/hydrogen antiporter [Halogeometricum pallidum JCM 14848]|uniref:NhaC-type sodium/hydrogen antiporter n=1 Tax=Halogeometricum pallidum JCM 14848 TaxID=1227487 RepID=M0D842_HALPD|nr:Na+/H+ antiporter NhaC family protein [Halogeometricum pallidum]ELZ31641.1 NhaC-type sodium/hydrogen antiporter [Halogeometricum pallidum JCM 14848]
MPAESYGAISLLPALFAIVLTLVSRQVLLSLFTGIWIGATILVGWNPIAGMAHSLQLVINSLITPFNSKLLLFTFLSGAMLGMIFLSGGMKALAERIIARIKTRKQAELGTSILGMLIFVDSYASTMITGSVMRPITDQFDISREKLAYLLDSTTSPVVSIAVVSTWVGFEVGLIRDQFSSLGIDQSAFVVFLQSIPYRFYSLLAIALVFILVVMGWNFGPMKRAERRAKEEGKVLGDDADPLIETREEDIVTPDHVDSRWWYFALPIVALVAVTGFGLLYSGGWPSKAPVEALKGAATADAILWGVFSACALLLAILVGHARVELEAVSDSIFEGFKMVMFPVAVLTLAWTIGGVSETLGVGGFVVSIAEGIITAPLLPAVVFVAAAIVSFSIGTSWGTMGIMFPVAVPLAFQLGAPLPSAIGAILTGSLFGDHCSPISDTTVLSSMFAGADHVDHVNTQIPYAVLCGTVGTLLFLANGYGLSGPILLLPVGVLALFVTAYYLSEHRDAAVPSVFGSSSD